jgi:hypothetical protein
MATLGKEPFYDEKSGMTIRKCNEMPRGVQAFWTSKNGGYGVWAGWITEPIPTELRMEHKPDTIVLNPLDYEAVKKSVMETPKRDRAREMRKRGYGDLIGFDPAKRIRESMARQREIKEKLQ